MNKEIIGKRVIKMKKKINKSVTYDNILANLFSLLSIKISWTGSDYLNGCMHHIF